MPSIATCQQCSAAFVPDEANGRTGRGRGAARSRCETCRRELLEKSLLNNRESVIASASGCLIFLLEAIHALHERGRRGDSEWIIYLGISAALVPLAAFYHFRRVRPQIEEQLADAELDRTTSSCPDTRRLQRLQELGHPIDCLSEARASRRRSESLVGDLVSRGLISAEYLREMRRRNRLFDQIESIDAELDRLERQTIELDEGQAGSSDPHQLECRRLELQRQLARRPLWRRLWRAVVVESFFVLTWLPFIGLAWIFGKAAWELGSVIAFALALGVLLIPAGLWADTLRLRWAMMTGSASAKEPAWDDADEALDW